MACTIWSRCGKTANDKPVSNFLPAWRRLPTRAEKSWFGICGEGGHPLGDVLYRRGEELFRPVFESDNRLSESPPIERIRERVAHEIGSMHEEFLRLRNPEVYRVLLSEEVGKEKGRLIELVDRRSFLGRPELRSR